MNLFRIPATWLALFLLSFAFPVKGVLFFHTGDTNLNTTPPMHAFTNSGWQFEGPWAAGNGTVISSNCFITAQHIGGAVGDVFTFQNVQYTTVTNYDDPNTDLRIWRVSGQFPIYAPLYTKRNEVGKALIVIGRGTQRGDEVRLKNRLRGWQWGVYDGVQRWGQNRVNRIVEGKGELLRASFNAGGGRNQAMLSVGDSGGAVFIRDGKFYKLAGVNLGVDGPNYNTTNSGTGFKAALFNQRGFYVEVDPPNGTWELFPQNTGRIASSFYATRISSRMSWITNVLALPAP